jgi:hypothetical protein
MSLKEPYQISYGSKKHYLPASNLATSSSYKQQEFTEINGLDIGSKQILQNNKSEPTTDQPNQNGKQFSFLTLLFRREKQKIQQVLNVFIIFQFSVRAFLFFV